MTKREYTVEQLEAQLADAEKVVSTARRMFARAKAELEDAERRRELIQRQLIEKLKQESSDSLLTI